MPEYTSRGLRLRYETVGEGRPVVLLHGLSNHCLAWAPQLDALAAADWRAILPDHAGHGLSATVAEPTTTGQLAGDVVALLDALEVPAAPVCGLSLGGMVAQQLLVDHPERVGGALVLSTGPLLTFPGAAQMVASWTELWLSEDGPRRRLEATWPVFTSAEYRDSPAGRAFYASWRRLLGGVRGESLAAVAAGLLSFDVTAALPAVTVPVLAVAGEDDPGRAAAGGAGRGPGPRRPLRGRRRARHLVNLERLDRVNELLLDLLAGLPP